MRRISTKLLATCVFATAAICFTTGRSAADDIDYKCANDCLSKPQPHQCIDYRTNVRHETMRQAAAGRCYMLMHPPPEGCFYGGGRCDLQEQCRKTCSP